MNEFGRQKVSNDWRGSIQNVQGEIENRDKNWDAGHGTLQRLDSIQNPGKRYVLKNRVGFGVCGDVYEAIDQQAGIQHKTYSHSAIIFLKSFHTGEEK